MRGQKVIKTGYGIWGGKTGLMNLVNFRTQMRNGQVSKRLIGRSAWKTRISLKGPEKKSEDRSIARKSQGHWSRIIGGKASR